MLCAHTWLVYIRYSFTQATAVFVESVSILSPQEDLRLREKYARFHWPINMKYCTVAHIAVSALFLATSATSSAVVAPERSKRGSSPGSSLSKRAVGSVIDDSDPQVTYTGNWTHFNKPGTVDFEGTESFSNDPTALVYPTENRPSIAELADFALYIGSATTISSLKGIQ